VGRATTDTLTNETPQASNNVFVSMSVVALPTSASVAAESVWVPEVWSGSGWVVLMRRRIGAWARC
jgi:hypothetical protein